MSWEERLAIEMLRRNHDLRGFHRLSVFVADRDLALGVGTERFRLAGVPRLRHQLQDAVRIIDRRRHEFRRLVASVAEHDALIARAFVLVAGGIDALRDIRRLRVQQDFDVGVFPMKAFLLVSDVLDRGARALDQYVLGDGARARASRPRSRRGWWWRASRRRRAPAPGPSHVAAPAEKRRRPPHRKCGRKPCPDDLRRRIHW